MVNVSSLFMTPNVADCSAGASWELGPVRIQGVLTVAAGGASGDRRKAPMACVRAVPSRGCYILQPFLGHRELLRDQKLSFFALK